MTPRLKMLVLLLAGLATVGLWSFAGRRAWKPHSTGVVGKPAPRLPETPRDTVEEVLPGVKGVQRVLTVGWGHRYTFDLDTRTSEQLPGAETGRSWRHTGWSGVLELTYLGVEGGRHFFAGTVVPTRVEVEEREGAALEADELRAFRTLFERPVYVAQDVRGRVLAVHFDAGQDVRARRFVRSLLAATQFVAEEGQSWSTEETDTTGDFESEYRAGGSANTYVKTKRRYLRTALPLWAPTGPRGPGVIVPRLRGHLDFTLDEAGLVREVTGSDVVETGGGATGLPHARAETRVAMTREVMEQRQVPTLRDFQRERGRLSVESLSAPEPRREGVAAVEWDRRRVGDATLETLLKVLETEPREQERAEARERLAALFRLTPMQARAAGRRVEQGMTVEVSRDVLEALGSAGTPEAQQALAKVMEEARLRMTTRARAAEVAGRVERPSAELTRALQRALGTAGERELRSAVVLALGAVSKGLEQAEPGRALDVLEGLLKRCEAKRVDAELCLRALTQSGSARGLDYARAALSHPSVEVREAATEALGATAGAVVDGLLDKVLLEDADARVRARAAVVISRRVAGPHLRAAAQALRTEPDAQVRTEVVRMLGNVLDVEDLAVALLREVAVSDDSDDVRRLALLFLAQ